MFFKFLLLVSFTTCILSKSNGWNDNIAWESSMDSFKAKIIESGKPGMLVIHKSWCGACKALKPKFAESKEIEEASENFVMFNALDDDEPNGNEFKPDGGYIPRILFLDGKGNVVKDLVNKGRDSYKYYYPSPNDVVRGMKNALEHFENVKEEL